jgi:hypothetical protein
MHRRHHVKTALCVLGLSACTSARPRGEIILPPEAVGPADTGTAASPLMALLPGVSRYDLEQHAVVRVEGADDSLPHTITTRALVLVEVLSNSDSSYDVTVSVDSLSQTAEGFGRPSPTHPTTLGAVLRVSLTPAGNSAQAQLADSLCAYSQFVTIARQLVLPRIPAYVTAEPARTLPDTLRIASCRAGVPISIESTQELRDLGGTPPQVGIDERATVRGSGMIQRDSITIDGSLKAQGSASFTAGSRLPSLVQTRSEGSIRIGLGDSTVTFKQSLTQQLRRRDGNLPN